MAVVQNALDDEVELNINLKRIAKERANADRHLNRRRSTRDMWWLALWKRRIGIDPDEAQR